jgi:5,10-methylenetetrahydromethanopterin reductase
MRIGALIDVDKPLNQVIEQVQGYADAGFASAWASQIFGYDALTLFGVIGTKVEGIELGTGVVPVYGRHPQVLAQQALTVQAASGNRLTLGIGLSHQVVVEGLWGFSYEKPARYMREYLSALVPMLEGQVCNVQGEVVTANTYAPLDIPGVSAPPVLVAALGTTMLKIAGRMASGTVTWMTGVSTIAGHIAPTITAAAAEAGRPAPRIGVALPVTVTADAQAAKERIDKAFAIYPTLPSYRAMLDKEGAERPSDIALVGSESEVAAALGRLADAGATDFVASIIGSADERKLTESVLLSHQA